MRTSTPGEATPTVPSRMSPTGFSVQIAVFSVCPYPSRTGIPMAHNHSSTAGAIGAAPLIGARTRDIPSRSRNARNTSNPHTQSTIRSPIDNRSDIRRGAIRRP
jgi:hypothetical protein